ncbi:unnamed protein product [Oncorhynchus mykiss]|uniref:T-complex protein 11-like protein 1 n=1 Tax=Oncorhynchus mykiss TaxID=8022 RepID=A0A060XIK7_ONCMY|nr:unnamed protein product [Oncorhynchus mykiss]
MPKDSDKPGGGEDRTDSSEQSHSKRVWRGTPSPHRGNTPQSSPPRFVSAEELMETAKGVTNMALAHEIVVNTDFQVKPSEPAEGSLEKRVKDIMHKAFWDVLEGQLSENPPSYNHAIKLLAEIKETLLSFLLPGHGRLRGRIEEVLDLSLIQQQAENGALDISKVVEFVIGMMGSLCAPSRDEEIRKLREITDLVPLLKAIFPVMDKMKLDMANFAVSSIRPHLLQQSVEYERKKFQEFVEKQPMYNTTGEAISGLPGLMDRLKRTIGVLLTEMHMPSFIADEALATIGERMCVELSGRLSEHGFSPFSTNRQSILKGQISAVTLPDNAIRRLIGSRIQTYLLAFLESSHRSAPTLPGGLAPVSKELEEIAMKFGRLVHFNKLVYSPFYQKILQEIVQEGESNDT